MKQNRLLLIVVLGAGLMSGCFGRKKAEPVAGTSVEPDKILYDRATTGIQKGRYAVARLDLQTLINTYPDSEYLAKAKLAIADSYYRESGTAGLKQAIVEYKDFITFFPFLDESAYAQLQVAMAHYRQMDKPDRDHAEAVDAEAELQTFLEKYPNSPLYPQAQQRLRETQEVLAEGSFRIARFYQIRGAYRAAGARLIELTTRYPLYSQADQANFMLAQIYEKTERNDFASQYYTKIVKEYPLSPLVPQAKERLNKLGAPVPQPDPIALARMQKDQEERDKPGLVHRSLGFVRKAPDMTMSAKSGDPTMTPAGESGDETLSLGPAPGAGTGIGSAIGSNAAVETVTPGTTGSASTTTESTPSASDSSATAAANTDAGSTSAGATASDSAASTSATPSTQTASKAAPADKSVESTSKKKKGIHKVLPF